MKNAAHYIEIPINKIPPEMKDGRNVMLIKQGMAWCCHYGKNGWYFGDELFLGATHFMYRCGEAEMDGSGI